MSDVHNDLISVLLNNNDFHANVFNETNFEKFELIPALIFTRK